MNLEQPDIRSVRLPDGTEVLRLWQPFTYEWEIGGVRRRLRMAAGFEHDGASVPQPLWSLTGIERRGLQDAAALIHDAMYRCSGRPNDVGYIAQEIWSDGRQEWEVEAVAVWTRSEVDHLFCRMLREAGVSMLKRRMMYRGVWLAGWVYWGKKEKRS